MKPIIKICFDQLAYSNRQYQIMLRDFNLDCTPSSEVNWILGGSLENLIVFPSAGNINKTLIIDQVKQYFEIFDITVQEACFSSDEFNTETNVLVKVMSLKVFEDFYRSKNFNDIPDLFRGFKKFFCVWPGEAIGVTFVPKANPFQIPADLGLHSPCCLVLTDFYRNEDVSTYQQFIPEQIASAIVHEAGHVLGLQHQGDLRNKSRDGLNYYGREYQHESDWCPVMGRSRRSVQGLSQWTDGLYPSAWSPVGEQNDIETMMVSWGLKKRPPYINYNIKTNYGIPQKLPRLARMITKEDIISAPNGDKAIEGMIGHPYDYDILKIVLEAGQYSFSIDSSIAANKVGVTLDPNMTNLYCECELNKEKENINISNSDAFQGEWPTNAVFKKIGFDRDETHIRFDGRLDAFKFKTSKFDLNLDKTTLVYIKVCGDWKDPVDGTKMATEVGKGYGQYGSMGRYYLKFEGKAPLGSKNDSIPNAHCEIFTYCDNGQYNQKIALLVQDSKDEAIQGSLQGIHTKEYDIILNGETEKRKFLVYGEPKPLTYNPPAGVNKFYLTILDPSTNECKKQEFIVGQILPDKLI